MVEYLIDPEAIDSALSDLPTLRSRLRGLENELRASNGFPAARKTQREIARLLTSRVVYEHLDHLLRALERCLIAGWDAPKLFRTKGRGDFPSLIAEVLVADWFLGRGFRILSCDADKRNDPVPDLLVERGTCRARIEVYRPRDWEGMEAMVDELRLAVTHLDVPYDFEFSLAFDQLNRFIDGRLVWQDPWAIATKFENQVVRQYLIDDVSAELATSLEHGMTDFTIEREFSDINTVVRLQISDARVSSSTVPDRPGITEPPSLTGYAPEGMFRSLVRTRVLAKARNRQTRNTEGAVEVLIVDISALGCCPEFSSLIYLRHFATSADEYLREENHDLDIIAFVRPRLLGADFLVPLVVQRDTADGTVAKEILGCELRQLAA